MIRLGELVENNDGRRDIILNEDGIQQLVIRQEFYEFYNISYEEMKTDHGLASFLIFVGVKIAKGSK